MNLGVLGPAWSGQPLPVPPSDLGRRSLRHVAALLVVAMPLACAPPTPHPTQGTLTAQNAYGQPAPSGAETVSVDALAALVESGDGVLLTPALAEEGRAADARQDAEDRALIGTFLAEHPTVVFPIDLNALAQNPEPVTIATPSGEESFTLDPSSTSVAALAASIRASRSPANLRSLYRTVYESLSGERPASAAAPEALDEASVEVLNQQLASLGQVMLPSLGVLPPNTDPPGIPASRTEEVGVGSLSDAAPVQCETWDPNGIVANTSFFLEPFLTSVKHQAKRGTCVSFGAVATIEAEYARQTGRWANFSEQHLYATAKGRWQYKGDYPDGLKTTNLATQLTSESYVFHEETLWNYNRSPNRGSATVGNVVKYTHSCDDYPGVCSDTNHQSKVSCASAGLLTWCVRLNPLQNDPGVIRTAESTLLWNPLDPDGSLALAKTILQAGHPLLISAELTSSWRHTEPYLNTPQREFQGIGGHAMSVVGFVSNAELAARVPSAPPGEGGGYFIIKNSWGTCYGDRGLKYVSYNTVRARTTGLAVLALNRSSLPTGVVSAPSLVSTPGAVTITATPDTTSVPVASVEFFDGPSLISSKTVAPYTASWTVSPTTPMGTHRLWARVKATNGKQGLWGPRAVVINVSTMLDGGAATDAGAGVDAGSGAADAGPTLDGGASDSGVVSDAGSAADAGTLSDAGGVTDAGTLTDAGSVTDAGTPTDAGSVTDAGTPTDAGGVTDAGTATDAGAASDAGIPSDAGTPTDAGAVDAGVPPPVIHSFLAMPTLLPADGGAVTLTWDVVGASSLVLSPGGPVGGNSTSVNVTADTVFTLTASSAGGSTNATASVLLSSPPNTLYVALDGDDSNAGTVGSPFRTLAKAFAVADAGFTVIVKGGVYDGTTQPSFGLDGGPLVVPDQLSLLAEPGATVTFRGARGPGLRLEGNAQVRRIAFNDFAPAIVTNTGSVGLDRVSFSATSAPSPTVEQLSVAGDSVVALAATGTFGYVGANLSAVIGVRDQGRLVVTGGGFAGLVDGGSLAAFAVGDQAMLVLDGVAVSNVATRAGFEVGGQGSLVLTQSTLTNVGTAAAVLFEAGSPTASATGCTIQSGAAAFKSVDGVATSPSVTLQTSTLQNNTVAGLSFGLASSPTITCTQSTVSGNGVGVELLAGGSFTGTACALASNATRGLWVGTMRTNFVRLRSSPVTGNAVEGLNLGGGVFAEYDLGTVTDPGFNTFDDNGAAGPGLVSQAGPLTLISAEGNAWRPNVQGASATGHYTATGPSGTVLDLTGALPGGANVVITTAGSKVRLAQVP